MKLYKLYIFIILISLLPLIDIFSNPGLPHTSDGAMHLARFAAYYKEFINGQIPVRWASQFNYGYGTPIFNFFHPLPYIIGIPFIGTGLSLVMTLKISFAISYILAGIFMFIFAMSFYKNEKMALLVTVMYQFAPYRLVEMLVRGSLGSLYSYTLLPLVLYGLVKLRDTKSYKMFFLTSAATALLSMSHNIIGFVFFGLCFCFAAVFNDNRKSRLISISALFSGLLISAFYLIPAIIEHKYTYGYLYTKDLFFDHFAPLSKFLIPNIFNTSSLRIAEVPVQIGLFHTMAIIFSVIGLYKSKKDLFRRVNIFSLIILSGTLFLMTSGSKLLWENISVLRQFQYPWRLLAVFCFLTAFISVNFFDFSVFKNKFVYWIIIVITAGSTYFYWTPYQGYQKIDENYYWNYPMSTNYYGEVDSIWMGSVPREFPESRVEVVGGDARITNEILKPLIHTFTVEAESESNILDRTEFYPGWKAYIDGKPVAIQFQDQNYRGLITFAVPSGKHDITVKYSENKLQKISDLISLTTVSCLLITGVVLYIFRTKIKR